MIGKKDFDAVVVGSGPNGLSAAITLQQAGLSVLLIEGKSTIGGGLRTAALTLPGFYHDVCSAIHPLAIASPFFKKLPLSNYGLQFIHPSFPAAHPFDDGTAAVLHHSLEETAASLVADEAAYTRLIQPMVHDWPLIEKDVLAPLHFPENPFALGRFGLRALQSAKSISKKFRTREGKGLWAGMAAHSIQPLTNWSSAAIGFVLMLTAHRHGWPIPKGGSQSIADVLSSCFISLGGKVETNTFISDLSQLPSSHVVLFDVTPQQLLKIAGHKFSPLYKWQLRRFRYGMGVFKIDWALDAPIPFLDEHCRGAGTVHLGGSFEEIALSEQQTWNGRHVENPFVLLAQPSLFDNSRAPEGKHTAWAYCHVPNGSEKNMTEIIERQVERFAPGFRERILATHTMTTTELETYNPNYVGGDINGGVIDLSQLFTRPALRFSPYRSSTKGIYICSSSTPPGGGVHGMCGYHAAKRVLRDLM